MIEVILNDRLGKKVRIKCNEDDTIGDLKKLVAAQTGTRPEKIRIQVGMHVEVDGGKVQSLCHMAIAAHGSKLCCSNA